MEIYVVQPGDTVYSIAEKYNIPVWRLIRDNVIDPNRIPIGQPLIIAYPLKEYVVKEGDTVESISKDNNIPLMQLLRNNNFLFDRNNIYPGETLVISYDNTKCELKTNGYANDFIDLKTLERTLPYLTYLSVFGYQPITNGEIKQIKDEEILKMAKAYGVAPLLSVSALSIEGVSNPQNIFDILANDKLTDNYINNSISIIKSKGYYGINVTYLFISSISIKLYENFTKKLLSKYKSEGLKVFITLNTKQIKEEIMNKLIIQY